MGTAVRTAKTSPASWDAFTDIDAFVDEVLAEFAAMEADGTKPTRSRPKPALTGAALLKAIMAIWCLCFCDIPFGTLFTLFTRWTRLVLWCRLFDRLRHTWRLACGDTAEPSAVVIDSRSCKSAPSCFERGFDSGKKIQGVKVHLGVEKYGIPLAIDVSPANVHDTKGIVPMLHELSGKGFRGSAPGRSRLPEQALGQGRSEARDYRQGHCPRSGREIPPDWVLLDGGAVFCLDLAPPTAEHRLRADQGAPRRLHRDRLRFHPRSALEALGDRAGQCLTSTDSL
jgi:hypothetical protein